MHPSLFAPNPSLFQVSSRIVTMLNDFIRRDEPSSRLLAVQFANALFPKKHLPSRMVCLMGSVDVNTDVATESVRGLQRPHELERSETASAIVEIAEFPDFAEAVAFFWHEVNSLVAASQTGAAADGAAALKAG